MLFKKSELFDNFVINWATGPKTFIYEKPLKNGYHNMCNDNILKQILHTFKTFLNQPLHSN